MKYLFIGVFTLLCLFACQSNLGIKNKLIVLIDWIWNYFTYDRSMRFILFIQKHKQDGTQGTEPTL